MMHSKNTLKKNKARFGGLRLEVFNRDKNQCVDCGMNQKEHVKRWGKSLTINHINGVGRNSVIPDNRIENLETLCLKCHGIKDSKRTKGNQYGLFK